MFVGRAPTTNKRPGKNTRDRTNAYSYKKRGVPRIAPSADSLSITYYNDLPYSESCKDSKECDFDEEAFEKRKRFLFKIWDKKNIVPLKTIEDQQKNSIASYSSIAWLYRVLTSAPGNITVRSKIGGVQPVQPTDVVEVPTCSICLCRIDQVPNCSGENNVSTGTIEIVALHPNGENEDSMHKFHKKCMEQYINTQIHYGLPVICPNCRQPFNCTEAGLDCDIQGLEDEDEDEYEDEEIYTVFELEAMSADFVQYCMMNAMARIMDHSGSYEMYQTVTVEPGGEKTFMKMFPQEVLEDLNSVQYSSSDSTEVTRDLALPHEIVYLKDFYMYTIVHMVKAAKEVLGYRPPETSSPTYKDAVDAAKAKIRLTFQVGNDTTRPVEDYLNSRQRQPDIINRIHLIVQQIGDVYFNRNTIKDKIVRFNPNPDLRNNFVSFADLNGYYKKYEDSTRPLMEAEYVNFEYRVFRNGYIDVKKSKPSELLVDYTEKALVFQGGFVGNTYQGHSQHCYYLNGEQEAVNSLFKMYRPAVKNTLGTLSTGASMFWGSTNKQVVVGFHNRCIMWFNIALDNYFIEKKSTQRTNVSSAALLYAIIFHHPMYPSQEPFSALESYIVEKFETLFQSGEEFATFFYQKIYDNNAYQYVHDAMQGSVRISIDKNTLENEFPTIKTTGQAKRMHQYLVDKYNELAGIKRSRPDHFKKLLPYRFVPEKTGLKMYVTTEFSYRGMSHESLLGAANLAYNNFENVLVEQNKKNATRRAADEQARRAADEQARRAAEEQTRRAAEEQARRAAEEQARQVSRMPAYPRITNYDIDSYNSLHPTAPATDSYNRLPAPVRRRVVLEPMLNADRPPAFLDPVLPPARQPAPPTIPPPLARPARQPAPPTIPPPQARPARHLSLAAQQARPTSIPMYAVQPYYQPPQHPVPSQVSLTEYVLFAVPIPVYEYDGSLHVIVGYIDMQEAIKHPMPTIPDIATAVKNPLQYFYVENAIRMVSRKVAQNSSPTSAIQDMMGSVKAYTDNFLSIFGTKTGGPPETYFYKSNTLSPNYAYSIGTPQYSSTVYDYMQLSLIRRMFRLGAEVRTYLHVFELPGLFMIEVFIQKEQAMVKATRLSGRFYGYGGGKKHPRKALKVSKNRTPSRASLRGSRKGPSAAVRR